MQQQTPSAQTTLRGRPLKRKLPQAEVSSKRQRTEVVSNEAETTQAVEEIPFEQRTLCKNYNKVMFQLIEENDKHIASLKLELERVKENLPYSVVGKTKGPEEIEKWFQEERQNNCKVRDLTIEKSMFEMECSSLAELAKKAKQTAEEAKEKVRISSTGYRYTRDACANQEKMILNTQESIAELLKAQSSLNKALLEILPQFDWDKWERYNRNSIDYSERFETHFDVRLTDEQKSILVDAFRLSGYLSSRV